MQHKYQKTGIRKALMGFIAVLCLLLSSCLIKSQLKNLLDQDGHAAIMSRAVNNTNNAIGKLHPNICVVRTPSELWSAARDTLRFHINISSDTATLFVLSAFFIWLAGAFSELDASNRFYSGRSVRLATIPLFLSHRRLLI
ncbi:hypothetical protein [Arachidicoccus terrestris]|uniref:hypothetical protein n=1 Tax=Arachidicoccus terrestris TaxID=2875539 RepID=UPI001CC47ABB|nr:hypothetical protein [Arachidicoccus terrestris]UAY55523.1 hypothetical protein K9M52_00345 [Arachidicoccus terrestris]